jgi:Tol biopolymer transport system component
MLPPTLSPGEVRAHLAHVLSSTSFAGASRASALLTFLVEETLCGDTERLKEYTLGVEALGKSESFDPRTDPIVRTEMSRLRARLERYYASDPQADGVVITLRKGNYIPEFSARSAVETVGSYTTVPEPRSGVRSAVLWFVAGVVTASMVVVVAILRYHASPISSDEVRLEINVPATTDAASLAVSPDGRRVVFVASVNGQPKLWLRTLAGGDAFQLTGTERAEFPFWSPDSRFVGFVAAGSLKVIAVDSGAIQTLATPGGGELRGGTWSQRGIILFSGGPSAPIFRIASSGGERSAVTRPSGPGRHWFPQFLPDGRHFLFYVAGGPAPGLYGSDLDAPDSSRRILDDIEAATYAPASGHLLFVRQRTLFGQKFDPDRLELSGSPSVVAPHVVLSGVAGLAAVSASAAGPLIYRSSDVMPETALVWFDRSGREIERVANSGVAARSTVQLSPNGRSVVYERTVSGGTTTDIWLLDLERSVTRRLTADPSFDIYPIWSPDGRRIAFSSLRNGTWDVFVKNADGSGDDELLVGSDRFEVTSGDWSPDGKELLYFSSRQIYAVRVDGDRKAVQFSRGEANGAQFSPDGRWIALTSVESGTSEVYVQPFDGSGLRTQVTGSGGRQPRWRRDGRALFYVAADQRLMEAPLRFDEAHHRVEVGMPKALFPLKLSPSTGSWQYAVSADGTRFLVDTPEETTLPITVALNWAPK